MIEALPGGAEQGTLRAMTERFSFGKRVRFHRKRRGLLQRELGALLSRSEDWVYRVEADRIPVHNVRMLSDLARALRVQVQDLEEAPISVGGGSEVGVTAIRSALMRSRQLSGALYADREPPKLERLGAEVDGAWSRFQASDYERLTEDLPALLADARLAVCEHPSGRERVQALRLFALVCHVTAVLLRNIGETSLAWTASDQGDVAASESEDPAVMLALRRCVLHVQLGSDMAAEAVDVALRTMEGLAQRRLRSSPVALSLHGTLCLNAAVAAARLPDRPLAHDLLAQAQRAADRLGADGNAMWTSFGPTNVELHRLALALEFDDGQLAVDLASRLRLGRDLPLERRARARLDVARAFDGVGRTDEAADQLKRAFRAAPAQIRTHHLARTLAGRLHRQSARRDVYELALALGVLDAS
ncbi:helix-turn-helix domain-containing protein [Streptomyces sp. AN091965]|uniref:helix-turn-helix domain-containing protein n=1 Tax=Streptomyces sp. AN091965 TaxID=2927803 RepID=UPI001F6041E0|nr:helix-turn-helix transcriptional regulator [Streptomyces sp. AN091965]MCI3927891.1 helix-turn-helix domain-containing protein [Streptomyces sp. AN091965]